MIAALFPGQGSQIVGMAQDFYEQSPAAKRVLDEAEAALPGLLKIMWQGPENVLKLTANQQPALVAAGAAAFAAYREAGGKLPQYAAGHSLGEFTAHVAAGSLTVQQAVRLVHKRGSYMQAAVPQGAGAMAAVMRLEPRLIKTICDNSPGVVEVANYNGAGQTVISGEAAAVAAATEKLKAEGARVIPLKVSAPFHCSLMQPAANKLAADLSAVSFAPLSFPIISNVTADLLTDVSKAPKLLETQVTHSVRWTEIMQKFHELGVTQYLEFGVGQVLSGLVKRNLKNADAKSITDMTTLEASL